MLRDRGRGLAATMDGTQIGRCHVRGEKTNAENSRSRSVCGLDTDVFTDRSRTWIVRGHRCGPDMLTDKWRSRSV